MTPSRNALRSVRLSVLAALVAGSAVLVADSHTVSVDDAADFGAIKTFAVHEAHVNSEKPELNNRLFRQRIEEALRSALKAKKLQEATDRSDVVIDVYVAGMDFSVAERQPGVRLPGRRGMPGVVVRGSGPRPERFTEGTLVVDMTSTQTNTLVWRGTYYDEEHSGPTLSRKLSEDVTKLLADYPPKKK